MAIVSHSVASFFFFLVNSVDVIYHLTNIYLFFKQLHGEMCKCLFAIYCKILSLFPSLEAARPRSKSGIQALCSLHVALEKAKNVLQHCSECSKLYLVRLLLYNFIFIL